MDFTKLNWLRAGMLGANDGIISVSVILVSVVGVLEFEKLLLVGVSAIFAGALSMAVGEYVSVSAQRDAEESHNQRNLTNPWHAVISSATSFILGATIPFLAALLSQETLPIVGSVLLALVLTTFVSVKVGRTHWLHPLVRNLLGGGLALAVGVSLNGLFAS